MDAEFSLVAWDLLRGAPALTATGLSPASLIQQEPLSFRIAIRSGRTIARIVVPSGQNRLIYLVWPSRAAARYIESVRRSNVARGHGEGKVRAEVSDNRSACQIDEFRLGDSPWFWLALFGSVAIVGLSIVGGKYAKRQMRLEQRYQNRVQVQVERQSGKPVDRERVATAIGARPANPNASLTPLLILFACAAATGYVGLYVSYRRHQLRGGGGTGLNSSGE